MHRHVYAPCTDVDDCYWRCECGAELEGDEVTKRLNAVECLTAEDARLLHETAPSYYQSDEKRKARLIQYALALEGG